MKCIARGHSECHFFQISGGSIFVGLRCEVDFCESPHATLTFHYGDECIDHYIGASRQNALDKVIFSPASNNMDGSRTVY